MRTTIELTEEIKQKLVLEASQRNLKGYSQIIGEALCDYFKTSEGTRKKLIDDLKGCLSKKEYANEVVRLKEGSENWRD